MKIENMWNTFISKLTKFAIWGMVILVAVYAICLSGDPAIVEVCATGIIALLIGRAIVDTLISCADRTETD